MLAALSSRPLVRKSSHRLLHLRRHPEELIVFGEVGLAGEIRPCPRGQERLKEAAKLGFTVAIIPKANMPKTKIPGLRVIPVERIDQAISAAAELS